MFDAYVYFTYLQYKEPLSGGTENCVVESPNYIDERQRSSSKYPSLNQHLLNSGVNTNFPSPGNSYGVEYHGQSYVTGTSSLGSSQQHPHQPVILPAVPLPTGSSIAQGLNYGGYYGAQEELTVEEQPPQDDPTFQVRYYYLHVYTRLGKPLKYQLILSSQWGICCIADLRMVFL